MLAEQHDESAEGRRYLALDVLHCARLNLVTTADPGEANQPFALTTWAATVRT
ncbi:hypothetical protein [Cellulomonas carbonis]|uniref:Transposase n=1 Tax=Cellulomonas carbonis T26 TaxID=947969 RepID=A0A0A0BUU2_9CELL|nr:hypothetical protein [Cellulomonas carbonis]KGM10924.1 transposase [Cellulomonas carbonis T26]GGC12953.1 hypothetical protein GCM10010972_27870 [Cellulomonas carbonis]